MRSTILRSVLALCCFGVISAPSALAQVEVLPEVALERLPATIDEFLEGRERLGGNPSGATALFVAAMIRYAEDQSAGLPMLVSILVNDNTLLSSARAGSGYRGYDLASSTRFLIDRVIQSPWIPSSYIQGTSPSGGYQLPAGPLRLEFSENPTSQIGPDEVRIFVASTGADSPRPLRLKRNSAGIWKVAEFSSLVVGVRQPESERVDDL